MPALNDALKRAGFTARPQHLQVAVSVDIRKTAAQQWVEALRDVKPLTPKKGDK